ncbi:hypothetical protein K438DRAFT_1580904, partial [Mycena galopus ATCC 62051]
VDSIGDTGDPCGIPFLTGFISPRVPSRQIAACLSLRKDAVYLTSCSGILRRCIL